jgi:hypothetical protein
MMKRLTRGLAALAAAGMMAACGGGGGDKLPTDDDDGGSGGGGNGGGPVSDVSNGVPSQRSMSIAVETYNLDWSLDGDTTTVSVRVTDTAGNPVPAGTLVQFSTEGGQIQTSCALTGLSESGNAISACSVTFATQNVRPADGLVSIVAWMEGQEAFIDVDGNGRYDASEPFFDTGRLFRDDDGDRVYMAGIDELNVGGSVSSAPGLGTSACGAKLGASDVAFGFDVSSTPLSVVNTCDDAWGRTLVRANVELAVSDPRRLEGEYDEDAQELTVFTRGPFGDPMSLADDIRVAAPAGTEISVATPPTGCTITISPSTVLSNAVGPTTHAITASPSVASCTTPVDFKLAFEGYEVIVSGF